MRQHPTTASLSYHSCKELRPLLPASFLFTTLALSFYFYFTATLWGRLALPKATGDASGQNGDVNAPVQRTARYITYSLLLLLRYMRFL